MDSISSTARLRPSMNLFCTVYGIVRQKIGTTEPREAAFRTLEHEDGGVGF